MSVDLYDGPACPISFLHLINTVRFSPSAHTSGRLNIMTETRYDALSRYTRTPPRIRAASRFLARIDQLKLGKHKQIHELGAQVAF